MYENTERPPPGNGASAGESERQQDRPGLCFLVPLCQYVGERMINVVKLAIKELLYSKETPKMACVLWLQSHLTVFLAEQHL